MKYSIKVYALFVLKNRWKMQYGNAKNVINSCFVSHATSRRDILNSKVMIKIILFSRSLRNFSTTKSTLSMFFEHSSNLNMNRILSLIKLEGGSLQKILLRILQLLWRKSGMIQIISHKKYVKNSIIGRSIFSQLID